MKTIPVLLLLIFFSKGIFAQSINGTQLDGSRQNSLLTAVPFLQITPHPRSGAMGNAGVAIEADAGAPALNIAALAFLPTGSGGVAVSYSPWLRQLVTDMDLSYLSGYYRISEKGTLSGSLRYFSIGDIRMMDNDFHNIGVYSPNELAADIGYARSLGPSFALGGSFRFIYSNLFTGQSASGIQAKADKAFAADVSGLYRKEGTLASTPTLWSVGVNISNIGTKIAYSAAAHSYFLPINLCIGTAATLKGPENNRLTIALDFNKLLVPTQPLYDDQGNIIKGKDPDRSVPAGIFGSFSDAPGGFSEELKEIGISSGLEFCLNDLISFRGGYHYQNHDKGDLSYITLGTGINYRNYSFDFAYLPGSARTNPLAGTLRFGLQARFGRSTGGIKAGPQLKER